MSKFHVRINNGPEQKVKVRTGMYYLAAAAALANLKYKEAGDGGELVEIWSPRLLPEYGPYFYIYDGRTLRSVVKGPDGKWLGVS